MVKKTNVWTVIFAADLITYAIVGVSFSDATFMGAVFKRESHNMVYTLVSLLVLFYNVFSIR